MLARSTWAGARDSIGWYLDSMTTVLNELPLPIVPDGTKLRYSLVPPLSWDKQLFDFHDELMVCRRMYPGVVVDSTHRSNSYSAARSLPNDYSWRRRNPRCSRSADRRRGSFV